MKKLYLLTVLLLFAAATTSFARTVDVRLIYIIAPDTIKWKNPNTDAPTTFRWGFEILGPDTLLHTDTLYLRHLNVTGPNGTEKLHFLPAASLGLGDTVEYQRSFFFTSVSGSSPINFCDSVWVVDAANVIISDPNTANNKVCKSLHVKDVTPNSITEISKSGANNLVIYPNPASERISFSYDLNGKEAVITIRDLAGRAVHREQLEPSSGEQIRSLDVKNYAAGVYIIELAGTETKSIGRVVIQK